MESFSRYLANPKFVLEFAIHHFIGRPSEKRISGETVCKFLKSNLISFLKCNTPAMISSLRKSFEHKTKYEAIMRCTENQNRLLTLIVKLQNAWLTIFVVITHDISLCIISITKEEKVNKILT